MIIYNKTTMKKLIIIITLLTIALFTVSAQGIYLDVGLGYGIGLSFADEVNVSDTLKESSEDFNELCVSGGLKLGIGPIAQKPIYIVAAAGGFGHRFYDKEHNFQINTYYIGPGLIYYPFPFMQFALTGGYSFITNETTLTDFNIYNSKSGIGGEVSLALDLSRSRSGYLFGVSASAAQITLENEEEDVKMLSTAFSAFIKYTFRQKYRKSAYAKDDS